MGTYVKDRKLSLGYCNKFSRKQKCKERLKLKFRSKLNKELKPFKSRDFHFGFVYGGLPNGESTLQLCLKTGKLQLNNWSEYKLTVHFWPIDRVSPHGIDCPLSVGICYLEIWGKWLLKVGLLPWVTIEPNDRFVDSRNVSVQVQWEMYFKDNRHRLRR